MGRVFIAFSSHWELKPSTNWTRPVPMFEFVPELKDQSASSVSDHGGESKSNRGSVNSRGWGRPANLNPRSWTLDPDHETLHPEL